MNIQNLLVGELEELRRNPNVHALLKKYFGTKMEKVIILSSDISGWKHLIGKYIELGHARKQNQNNGCFYHQNISGEVVDTKRVGQHYRLTIQNGE